jgi:uncharacterized protein (TIGR03083 family)
MDTIQDMIAAQRGELAGVLAGLPASGWDQQTLCAGWRVREAVAHVTMPFRYSGRRFVLELAKSRGRFNEMADRLARRDAARMSPAELADAVTSNVSHPWRSTAWTSRSRSASTCRSRNSGCGGSCPRARPAVRSNSSAWT